MSVNREPKDFLAYVHWDVVLRWRAAEAQAGRSSETQRKKPYAYGTAKTTLFKKAQDGDTLWIVTIPRFGSYAASPSLLARLEISERIDQKDDARARSRVPKFIRDMWEPSPRKRGKSKRNWRYVVLAAKPHSRYFAINDAYSQLRALRFVGCPDRLPERLQSRLDASIGMHLQNIRELTAGSRERLRQFARQVDHHRNVFISYRRGRGGRAVRELVAGLTKAKVNCWLDENMLPSRIAQGEVRVSDAKLKASIRNAVLQSHLFVAIKRPDYFDSSWAKFEWDLAGKMTQGGTQVRRRGFSRESFDLPDILTSRGVNRAVRQIQGKL